MVYLKIDDLEARIYTHLVWGPCKCQIHLGVLDMKSLRTTVLE